MSQGDPRADSATPRRQATVLESVEEIRAAARRPATLREPLPSPAAGSATRPQEPNDDTEPFRPTRRPSMALLVVLDDGADGGETFRIRSDSFRIGRVEGDLLLPHDPGVSSRHAEVCRRLEAGQSRWYLADIQSTNGTFVRASNGLLRDRQEILLGSLRFRFEDAPAGQRTAAGPESGGHPQATQKWQSLTRETAARALDPSLVELTAEGEGRRYPLRQAEDWVGRDPSQCSIVLDDPMVSPRHARVFRDDRGRWHVQNLRSLNGLWMRITEVPIERGGQFQCGEQRFLIKIF